MNLKHCQGCKRDLPRHLFPRGKELCFNCTFNGPGVKEDVLGRVKPVLALETEVKRDEELVYVRHEQELLALLKEHDRLSTKELSARLGITRDATYRLCLVLVKSGRINVTKEARGPGKVQNIYSLPPKEEVPVEDEPENVQSTSKELQETLPEVKESNITWPPKTPLPLIERFYSARELADTYLEGFKEGFNTAVHEIGSPKKDMQEGQG